MFVSETFLRAGRPSYNSDDLISTLSSRYHQWHYVLFFSRQWSHDVQHNSITCPLIVLLFGCNDEDSKYTEDNMSETTFTGQENKVTNNNECHVNITTKNLNDANNWRLIFCKCIQDVRNVQRNFTEVDAVRVLMESTPIGLRPNRFNLLTVLSGETHEKINLFNAVSWTNMCNSIGTVVKQVDLLNKTKIMFSSIVVHVDNILANETVNDNNKVVCEHETNQPGYVAKSSELRIIQSAVEWFRDNGNVYHQMLSDCSLPSQEECSPLFHLLAELNPLLWCGNFVNDKEVNDDNNSNNKHNIGAEKTEKGDTRKLHLHESSHIEDNKQVCCQEKKQLYLKCDEQEHQLTREQVVMEREEEELKVNQKLNAMKSATCSLSQQKIGSSILFVIPPSDNMHTAVDSYFKTTNPSCNDSELSGTQINQTSQENSDTLLGNGANNKLSKNDRKRYIYAIYWQRPLSAKNEVGLDNYNAGPLSPQPVSAQLHLFTDRGDAFYIYQQMNNPSLNEFTFDDYLHEDGEVFVQLAPVEGIKFDDIDKLLNIVAEGKRAEVRANLHVESESCCSIVFPRVLHRTPTGHNVKVNPLAKYHSEIKQTSPSYEMVEDVICALKYISEHISSYNKCKTIASNEQCEVNYSLRGLCTIITFNGLKNCAWCGRAREKMLKCAACGAVWYCSRSHQILDWKEGNHKLECKDWKEAKQLYEENLKIVSISQLQEEYEENNLLFNSSISEILKSYCHTWNSYDRGEDNGNTATTNNTIVCSKDDASTTIFAEENAKNSKTYESNLNSDKAEVSTLQETTHSFDKIKKCGNIIDTDKSILENERENINNNENEHDKEQNVVIRADCCAGWSYAISTLEFVKQLLGKEAHSVRCNFANPADIQLNKIADLKQAFCVHIVGVDVSVYQSFLWLLAACIDSIKDVLLQTNRQIRIVLCSDTFTEFQRNEVWQVVEQVCGNTERLCAVKKVISTGVLGDTWREKQKDTHDAAEVSNAFVLVRLINTRYYLLHENNDLDDKSNWPNAVISFGPSNGTGCNYFNASMETIVNHFLGHVPLRFVESSYIGTCRTRRAILARISTSDKCDASVKKIMQNDFKRLTKAPMTVNVNKNIFTNFAFTGHAANTIQALNKLCTDELLQTEETKLDNCVDIKTNDGNSRNTQNTEVRIDKSGSNDSNNNNDNSLHNMECSNLRKNDINHMYVLNNGYYFDILPFC